MSKAKSIRESIHRNTMKTCAVQGCTRKRHSLSRYCSTHQHHYYNFGHPLAYKIMPKDIEVEKEMATDIINLNEAHEGIQYGIQFLDKLLLECAQGISFAPHSDYLASLHYYGVTGKELLATLTSLYILQDSQKRLIKSDRHLTFLLGHFALRMAKQASRVYGSHRKALGQYFQENLGVLCLNISKAAQQLALNRDETLLQMSKPLSLE